jgi:hypothetical protein
MGQPGMHEHAGENVANIPQLDKGERTKPGYNLATPSPVATDGVTRKSDDPGDDDYRFYEITLKNRSVLVAGPLYGLTDIGPALNLTLRVFKTSA